MGGYLYLKFKSDKDVNLKYKRNYDKISQKDKIIKILDWLAVVDENVFSVDEFKKAEFDTCYYKSSYDLHRNYITVQWLTYDKKSEYYYYGECSGIDGVHKYIYNPFLGFEAKSEEKEEKRKIRKR